MAPDAPRAELTGSCCVTRPISPCGATVIASSATALPEVVGDAVVLGIGLNVTTRVDELPMTPERVFRALSARPS